MNLQDLDLKVFLDKTRGSDPVPGGGSISALCGALAASLAEMVTGLTIGRQKYADAEDTMRELAPVMDDARRRFLAFIDEDARAYDEVFQAYKLPKDTDAQKAARKEAIREATLKAARVPMEVAKLAVSIMGAIRAIAEQGNRNAVTDGCVAMMCARTAALGAIFNVRINISSLNEEAEAMQLAAECDRLETEAKENENNLLSTINL